MKSYRLALSRKWLTGSGTVNWIMLNPSTADENQDDPTIRKCRGFSQRWGFSEMVVTNLFSLRATKPKDLREFAKLDYASAVGEENDGAIIECARRSDLVVAAWGTHGGLYGRDQDVICRVLPETKMWCIRKTQDGFPAHPCMAPYTENPVVFREWNQLPEVKG